MTIHEDLAAELKDAMRSGDRARRDVIRQVESEVSIVRSAPGFRGEVDDALYRRVIASYVKKMDKARAEFAEAGERGSAQVDKLTFEIDYLSRWVPPSLGEAETRDLVAAAIAELGASDPKMTGRVIGHVMKSGAEVDGALVAKLVKDALG
jgi:uncharacterized protein YqeY